MDWPQGSDGHLLAMLLGATLLPLAVYLPLARARRWSLLGAAPIFIAAALACVLGMRAWRRDLLPTYVHFLRGLAIPLELALFGWVLYALARTRNHLSRTGQETDFHARLRAAVRYTLGENRFADILTGELAVLYYGLFARKVEAGTQAGGSTFPYHRESGYRLIFPVLMAAIVVETLLVHVLLRGANPAVAWVLTALGLYSLLWFAADRRAMALRPHLLDGDVLRLRLGLRWDTVIPLGDVVSVRRASPPPAPRMPGYWRAVAFGAPQLLLELRQPVTVEGLYGLRKRDIHTLGVAVDAPEALERALAERMGKPAEGGHLGPRGDFYDRLHEGMRSAITRPALAEALTRELGVLAYGLFFWRLKPPPLAEGQTAFSTYRRSGYGAILSTLMAMIVLETGLVHLLLSRWSTWAAWTLTVLSLYSLLWLFGDYQALRLRPMLMDGERLHVRVGMRRNLTVPLSLVRALSRPGFGLPRRAPGYVRATPIGSPKLLLELREPLQIRSFPGGEQSISRIGLTVDDEAGFEQLLQSRLQPPAPMPAQRLAP